MTRRHRIHLRSPLFWPPSPPLLQVVSKVTAVATVKVIAAVCQTFLTAWKRSRSPLSGTKLAFKPRILFTPLCTAQTSHFLFFLREFWNLAIVQLYDLSSDTKLIRKRFVPGSTQRRKEKHTTRKSKMRKQENQNCQFIWLITNARVYCNNVYLSLSHLSGQRALYYCDCRTALAKEVEITESQKIEKSFKNC